LTTFTIPLAQLAEKYKADIETAVQKSTAQVFASVVLKTPVDTGRARANWNASQGAPNIATSLSVDQSRGGREAARGGTFAAGGVSYLTNGLAYIGKLEFGSSKQAPTGMVRTSAAEFADFVQRAIRETK
jgi:hypothetical protein